jgi:hypothetical protein
MYIDGIPERSSEIDPGSNNRPATSPGNSHAHLVVYAMRTLLFQQKVPHHLPAFSWIFGLSPQISKPSSIYKIT